MTQDDDDQDDDESVQVVSRVALRADDIPLGEQTVAQVAGGRRTSVIWEAVFSLPLCRALCLYRLTKLVFLELICSVHHLYVCT